MGARFSTAGVTGDGTAGVSAVMQAPGAPLLLPSNSDGRRASLTTDGSKVLAS